MEVVRDGRWVPSLRAGDGLVAATAVVECRLDREAFWAALNCHPSAWAAERAAWS